MLQKIERIYEDRDYLTRIKAVHIFIFNIFTLGVGIFASILYLEKGIRPGYVIITVSSFVSAWLIWSKKFEFAVRLNLLSGFASVTAGWFFGAKEGNFFFSISALILVFLYLSNIRNTILVSIYCFGLLAFRAFSGKSFEFQNLVSSLDVIIMYSVFAMVSIMTVRVIQNYSEEKDVLIKEIHHRVRNNLQVLSGLIDLQKSVLSPDTGKHFSEFQNRLFAISKIHDYVYKSKNYNRVNCKIVFQEILSNLIRATSSESVFVDQQIENLDFPIETAIPLALIFNEALLNSLLHGRSRETPSRLLVSLSAHGNCYHLLVSDNGPGLESDTVWREPSTIGFTLIRILAQQLRGDLRVVLDGGTRIEFSFDPAKSSLSL
ncbi:sensor histidine kinase [Leptospira wolffii]|uniref:sensor histidine kinase n=1 Tax=Leptospira wolffii TaxID=409998 RepID=UPI0002EB3275|nr:sensor histidine kinase [Leptospira wolffii]EPG65829.1 histidine kinase [Leptospira wolffii serovar Khorat str. Khorat-H2]